jgi:hypothetical protein
MHNPTALACFLFLFTVGVSAKADEWSEAEKRIVGLDPSHIDGLPKQITDELIARGCTIPQTDGQPHNAISGSFAVDGQKDWAVLCSRNGSSSIQVFWGGTVQCSSEIAARQNRDLLQDIGEGRIGYSRGIGLADKGHILAHSEASEDPQHPPIFHDGIDDVFMGKGSTIHYCDKGQWVQLMGAD